MIFFLYSLLIIKKIKSLFPGANIIKKWITIEGLIIIFIIGYITNIIFLALDYIELVNLMTAIVYFFGSLFVLIVIDLGYKTYKIILLNKT
ncbi:MAG: hypothetical protein ACTSXH_17400 [Promethearchaeota archaeon]